MVNLRKACLLPFFMVLCSMAVAVASSWSQEKHHVLVLRPDNHYFEDALDGLTHKLGNDYAISNLIIPKRINARKAERILSRLDQIMQEEEPDVVVAMNNRSISIYREYQNIHKDREFPPAVILMALYAQKHVALLKNATGIAYEVQAVTSLYNLRSMIQNPIRRVGVLYRPELKTFYESQRTYCDPEEIDLIGIELPESYDLPQKIKASLNELITQDVDALWVLNDSRTLTGKLLQQVWMPVLKDFEKPVVVGIEALVQDNIGLGHFAFIPEHFGLGLQAADMIFEIEDNGWSTKGVRFRSPISVKKIVNLKKLHSSITLQEDALYEIDKFIR